MDDQYCPAAGGGCEPQWIFGAWWVALVVGIALFAAYDRYRDRRLKRVAVGLGLAPGQRVVWGRGGPKWWGKWVVFGVLEVSLVTGIVVGALTDSFLVGFEAATIPLGVGCGIAILSDLRWLLTLHPTVDDIEPLDPE